MTEQYLLYPEWPHIMKLRLALLGELALRQAQRDGYATLPTENGNLEIKVEEIGEQS